MITGAFSHLIIVLVSFISNDKSADTSFKTLLQQTSVFHSI